MKNPTPGDAPTRGSIKQECSQARVLAGWGGRDRTSEWRNQNPLPYHLATPQRADRGQRRSIECNRPFQQGGDRNQAKAAGRCRRTPYNNVTPRSLKPPAPTAQAGSRELRGSGFHGMTIPKRLVGSNAMTYRAPINDILLSLNH